MSAPVTGDTIVIRTTTRAIARRAILLLVVTTVVAAAALGAVGWTVAHRTAQREAIRDALNVVSTQSRLIVPLVSDEVLSGDPAALDGLDAVVTSRVLTTEVVRVKIWAGDGRIVYSDDRRIVGETYPLGEDELRSLADGQAYADVSDLTKPENRGDQQYGKLREVYIGMRTPSGTPVLFETYLRADSLASDGNRILGAFAPVLFGGIAVVLLVEAGMAAWLIGRVDKAERERRRLLQHAVDSSDRERRRIASDLHDSVVQGLAGSSFALAALAEQAERSNAPELATGLRDRSTELRLWVRELRTLIVNMVPPRLHEEGLVAALADLVSPLSARGIVTTIDVDPAVQLDKDAEALVYRCAQEAVRNIANHAEARHVAVRVQRAGSDAVRLQVVDDGKGFSPADVERRAQEGHVGLSLLRDLIDQTGWRLRIDSAVGAGTSVTLESPR